MRKLTWSGSKGTAEVGGEVEIRLSLHPGATDAWISDFLSQRQ